MKQALSIALMSVFLSGAVLVGVSRETQRREVVHESDCQIYGYGMNKWARSEGRPEVCP